MKPHHVLCHDHPQPIPLVLHPSHLLDDFLHGKGHGKQRFYSVESRDRTILVQENWPRTYVDVHLLKTGANKDVTKP
jgi:hypothetical protein